MEEYLEYVRNLSIEEKFGYSCSIITNGSLITDGVIDLLKRHKCSSMQITIDGCKRTHDQTRKFRNGELSFERLINIINLVIGPKLTDLNCEFIIRFNLLNNTINEVKESLGLIEEKYRENISVFFRAIYDTSCFGGYNKNSVHDYFELSQYAYNLGFKIKYNPNHGRYCEVCSDMNFGYITPDLSFWKCLNAKDRGNEFGRLGKIEADGTLKINSERVVEWYKATNCFESEKCVHCSQLPDCMGGCAAYYLQGGCKERLCSDFNLISLPYLYSNN